MSRKIVFVAGSPSATSRSSLVAQAVAGHIERAGFERVTYGLGDFDPADVLFGRATAPALAAFVETVKGASALVLSTPVYKAAYTGGLKALVDLIPPDALVGRPILGVATARVDAHGPEVDRAYRALAAFFRARPIETLFALDAEIDATGPSPGLHPPAQERAESAARRLVAALEERAGSS